MSRSPQFLSSLRKRIHLKKSNDVDDITHDLSLIPTEEEIALAERHMVRAFMTPPDDQHDQFTDYIEENIISGDLDSLQTRERIAIRPSGLRSTHVFQLSESYLNDMIMDRFRQKSPTWDLVSSPTKLLLSKVKGGLRVMLEFVRFLEELSRIEVSTSKTINNLLDSSLDFDKVYDDINHSAMKPTLYMQFFQRIRSNLMNDRATNILNNIQDEKDFIQDAMSRILNLEMEYNQFERKIDELNLSIEVKRYECAHIYKNLAAQAIHCQNLDQNLRTNLDLDIEDRLEILHEQSLSAFRVIGEDFRSCLQNFEEFVKGLRWSSEIVSFRQKSRHIRIQLEKIEEIRLIRTKTLYETWIRDEQRIVDSYVESFEEMRKLTHRFDPNEINNTFIKDEEDLWGRSSEIADIELQLSTDVAFNSQSLDLNVILEDAKNLIGESNLYSGEFIYISHETEEKEDEVFPDLTSEELWEVTKLSLAMEFVVCIANFDGEPYCTERHHFLSIRHGDVILILEPEDDPPPLSVLEIMELEPIILRRHQSSQFENVLTFGRLTGIPKTDPGWFCKSITKASQVNHYIPFSHLMSVPIGIRCFADFLKMEFSDESLHFLLEAEKYRQISPDNTKLLKRQAKILYRDFFHYEAPRMINVSGKIRDQVTTQIQEQTMTPKMFDGACKELSKMLQTDSFVRFKRTHQFRDFLNTYEGNWGIRS